MIIDIHCHVGFSARAIDRDIRRFSFEAEGAAGRAGFDSYFSRRVMRKWRLLLRWEFVRRSMGLSGPIEPGERLDTQIYAFNHRNMLDTQRVDRMVLLAFDEYHTRDGRPVGPPERLGQRGSDLYTSNSLVRALCAAWPHKFLFGASIHPYRPNALTMLEELKSAGAVLIKWLPLHQNIDARDGRVIAFLRRAAELKLAMLIHYGGEMTLATQHPEFESPAGLLAVLRDLRREDRMPTTIVAHVATPSTIFHSSRSHKLLVQALTDEFRDAPLYADISGMSLGRAPYVLRFLRRPALQRKLVWGTDFPIPPLLWVYFATLGPSVFDLRHVPSWIERDLLLQQRLGLDEAVFHRGGEILDVQ
ncbi:MAG TPA: amidohydrolase family protein [Phycisphaerae bacterium]|jgi:predicted TIM-barrel fold metal-dependent hydrolase